MEKNDQEALEDHIKMAREAASDIAAFEGTRQATGSGISLQDACALATAHAALALMEIRLSEDFTRD
jgi:hypothetical protein